MRRVSARRQNKAEIKLTREEEEELLAEWKPEPLISGVDLDHEALHVPIIDHKVATISLGGSSINDVTQIWRIIDPLCHTKIKILPRPLYIVSQKCKPPSPY